MRQIHLIALLFFSVLFMAACASNGRTPDEALTGDSRIIFIDLDTFDMSMTRDMKRNADLVVVLFTDQPVTVNDMPDRLQKWLSAAHKHGHGLSVETRQGFVHKDILSVVGVLVAGYKMVKNNIPALISRKYKAVITVANSGGEIEKVEFIRF